MADPKIAQKSPYVVEVEPGKYEVWISSNERQIYNRFKNSVGIDTALPERAIPAYTRANKEQLRNLMGYKTRLTDAEKNIIIQAVKEGKNVIGIAAQDGRLICPSCRNWTEIFGIDMMSPSK